MGIADKLEQQDRAAARNKTRRWVVTSLISLAVFLLILFYFLLPPWRGSP
jgi:hypothetical protein